MNQQQPRKQASQSHYGALTTLSTRTYLAGYARIVLLLEPPYIEIRLQSFQCLAVPKVVKSVLILVIGINIYYFMT